MKNNNWYFLGGGIVMANNVPNPLLVVKNVCGINVFCMGRKKEGALGPWGSDCQWFRAMVFADGMPY